jgi:RNA polymerase sigma-70 factor (ECF subfamily)
MQGLLNLLTEDITLWPDSGGKVSSARNTIVGADHVARFLIGARRWADDTCAMRIIEGDGQIAVVEYVDGKVKRVNTFAMRDGRICAIYRVLNPDKLKHIPTLSSLTSDATVEQSSFVNDSSESPIMRD